MADSYCSQPLPCFIWISENPVATNFARNHSVSIFFPRVVRAPSSNEITIIIYGIGVYILYSTLYIVILNLDEKKSKLRYGK